MIREIYMILLLFFLSIATQSQNDIENQDTLINRSIDIEKIIKLKESDKLQQVMLIEFKKRWLKYDRILVKEFQNHYKLIVNHKSINGFITGV